MLLKKMLGVFCLVSLSLSACAGSSKESTADSHTPPVYQPPLNEVLAMSNQSYQGVMVDFREDVPNLESFIQNYFQQHQVKHSQRITHLEADNVYLIQADSAILSELWNSEMKQYVEYIEPNYVYSQSSTFLVDDPNYPYQWNFASIYVEEAWRFTTGKGVTVAVIDSGVVFGRDFDKSTFTPGFDFLKNKPISEPSDNPKESSDGNNHGTHIAGIIAQSTNNNYGFAGIAYNAKIMPIRVLDNQGNGTAKDIAKAIRWAVDNGADVINLSLANRYTSQAVREALLYAQEKNVLVVAAAGNQGKVNALYPARDESVIGVAAYSMDGMRASYSNYGEGVRVFAPGGFLTNGADLEQEATEQKAFCQELPLDSTSPLLRYGISQMTWRLVNGKELRDRWQICGGTSQATAHVSAVSALVISLLKPKNLDRPQLVKHIILKAAQREDCHNEEEDWNPGKVGRLDAGRAIQYTNELLDPKMRDNIALASHLSEIGAKVYGTCWCGAAQKQKDFFGAFAFSLIGYVECDSGGINPQLGACASAGISKSPTWEINGKQYTGARDLNWLADVSEYRGSRDFYTP